MVLAYHLARLAQRVGLEHLEARVGEHLGADRADGLLVVDHQHPRARRTLTLREQPVDAGQEARGVERLAEEGARAGPEGPLALLADREDEQAGRSGVGVVAQDLGEPEAVEPGHAHVEGDHVRMVPAGERYRLVGAGGDEDPVAARQEQRLEDEADVRLVVDDQHGAGAPGGRLRSVVR